MKLKTEIEVVINHNYKDMEDILDCIEEDIETAVEESVGKYLHEMLDNTSNVICNVISIKRIRDNIRFVYNLDDADTMKRLNTLIERINRLENNLNEEYIFDTFRESFKYYVNMHLAMLEGIIEEQEKKKEKELE